MARNRIFQRDPAIENAQRNGRSRELLGERGNVEGRASRNWRRVFQIGEAIAPGKNQVAVLDDPQSVSRTYLPLRHCKQLVDRVPNTTRK